MTKRRSQHWFGGQGKDAFIHRSWMKNNGLLDDAFDGRPVIGICNTFSEFTPCHAHFRGLVEHICAVRPHLVSTVDTSRRLCRNWLDH